MIPLTDPTSKFEEDFHRHDFYAEDGTHLATIEFDDIEDDRSGLWCEVTAWTRVGHTNAEPDIAYERINLLTKGNAGGGVKSVTDRLEALGSVNWPQGFSTAIFRTVTAYRRGSSEGEWLDPLDPDGDQATAPYLLEPFIASSGTTVLFGMYGSAKSMLAMRLSLTVATGKPFMGYTPERVGPVLYVDFEDDAEPHRLRLPAIGRPMGLEMDDLKGLIYHERVSRDLKTARRRLARIVRDHGIVMVVIDSVGLALAGDKSGSEPTIKLFKMFGRLGAAVLAIDHLTKENNTKAAKGELKPQEASPYGSQYTTSSSRLQWFLLELPQSSDKKKVQNLVNTKANHVPKHPPVGMTIAMVTNERKLLSAVEFDPKAQTFDSITQSAITVDQSDKVLLWHHKQQVDNTHVIPMTVSEIANGMGISRNSVASTINQRRAAWWEKTSKSSSRYIISSVGHEHVAFLEKMTGVAEGATGRESE